MNFESTTADLQNLRQGFDAFLRTYLIQNFKQVSEIFHAADSRNNTKISHLQQNLQHVFTQLENFSSRMQEMQSRLQQRDNATTGADLGSHVFILSNAELQNHDAVILNWKPANEDLQDPEAVITTPQTVNADLQTVFADLKTACETSMRTKDSVSQHVFTPKKTNFGFVEPNCNNNEA